MHMFVEDSFHRHFCKKILNSAKRNNRTLSPLVSVSFGSCEQVFATNGYGTGNFLMSIYTLRSVAQAIGDVNIYLSCDDAYQQRGKLILPWLTGWFPQVVTTTANNDSSASIFPVYGSNVTSTARCMQIDNTLKLPLAKRIHDIQYDLRRMAVSLIGIPSKEHPSLAFAESHLWINKTAFSPVHALVALEKGESAVLSNIELDDAVLHFRCGDLILSTEPRYGFMKFDSYANHISPEARSIGIVTESFDTDGQHRQAESRQVTRDRCRIVVNAFVEQLKKRFPDARVSIRNGREETIASTYSRMIMANQTIISLSTFAFFPAIATFGKAFIRRPSRRNLGAWIVKAVEEEKVDNVVLIDEPDWLPTARCKRMWGEDGSAVLEWFRSETTSKQNKKL